MKLIDETFSKIKLNNVYNYAITNKIDGKVTNSTLKTTVTELTPDKKNKITKVTLFVDETRTENGQDKTTSYSQEESIDQFAAIFPANAVYTISQEKLNVDGKVLACLKVEVKSGDQNNTTTAWICSQDGMGLVKMDVVGKDFSMSMSLKKWTVAN